MNALSDANFATNVAGNGKEAGEAGLGVLNRHRSRENLLRNGIAVARNGKDEYGEGLRLVLGAAESVSDVQETGRSRCRVDMRHGCPRFCRAGDYLTDKGAEAISPDETAPDPKE